MAEHIPKQFIDNLLDKTNIVETIDSLVSLTKRGNNYIACCPFHQEKTPSFTVSHNKQFFHCFGCQVSGNVITFIMEYKKISFVDSLSFLAQRQGLIIPTTKSYSKQNKQQASIYNIINSSCEFYQQQLRKHPAAQNAINALKKRNISGKTAKHFKIGFSPPEWNSLTHHLQQQKVPDSNSINAGLIIKKNNHKFDRFRNRIMFPITNTQGHVAGFGARVINSEDAPKYLNSPESPAFSKSNIVYGLHEIINNHRKRVPSIIAVEGYLDVLQLFEHGIMNSVATLGTATTRAHIDLLFKHTNKILFCFDGDDAGKNAAWKAILNSIPLLQENRSVAIIFMPDNHDPDSYIRSQGKEKFQALIKNHINLENYLFKQLSHGLNMNAVDGKANLISKAIPLINQIPNKPTVDLMYRQLSKLTNLEVHNFKDLNTINAKGKHAKIDYQNPVRSKENLALAILLQYPEITANLPDNIINNLKSHKHLEDILNTALIIMHNKGELSTGSLIEHWRHDASKFKIMSKLASIQLEIPEEGIQNEFCAAINTLVNSNTNDIIQQLLAKGKENELSDEDRQQLQKLIFSQKLS